MSWAVKVAEEICPFQLSKWPLIRDKAATTFLLAAAEQKMFQKIFTDERAMLKLKFFHKSLH